MDEKIENLINKKIEENLTEKTIESASPRTK